MTPCQALMDAKTVLLVDHDRAGFDRPRRELSGDLIGRAGDDQIDSFKGRRFHQLDGQHFVAVTNLGAGAASRGKQTQFPHGELASVELVQNDSANGTGGTDECNAIKHEWSGDGETKWGGKRVFSRQRFITSQNAFDSRSDGT